jgi:hypothetical protein
MQNGQFQQSDWQDFRMTEIGILRALEYILSILRKIARVRGVMAFKQGISIHERDIPF